MADNETPVVRENPHVHFDADFVNEPGAKGSENVACHDEKSDAYTDIEDDEVSCSYSSLEGDSSSEDDDFNLDDFTADGNFIGDVEEEGRLGNPTDISILTGDGTKARTDESWGNVLDDGILKEDCTISSEMTPRDVFLSLLEGIMKRNESSMSKLTIDGMDPTAKYGESATSNARGKPELRRERSSSAGADSFLSNEIPNSSETVIGNNAHARNNPKARDKRHTMFGASVTTGSSPHGTTTKITANRSQLRLQPVHREISQSLATSIIQQHAEFAHGCLDLLEQQDRNESLRRKSICRALLKSNKRRYSLDDDILDEGEDGEDESCPLMSLIKAGPLYKLHEKGGNVTRKLRYGRNTIINRMNSNASSRRDSLDSDYLTSSISSTRSISRGSYTLETGITTKLLHRWRPKYVEVHKGVLSFYDDVPSSGQMRKNIPLQASLCTCRAIGGESNASFADEGENFLENSVQSSESQSIDSNAKSKGAISATKSQPLLANATGKKGQEMYAFELIVQGDTPSIWATGSEVGRKAWMDAMYTGMTGFSSRTNADDGICSPENYTSNPQYAPQIKQFQEITDAARSADSLISFAKTLCGSSLSIPVPLLLKSFSYLAVSDDLFDGMHNYSNDAGTAEEYTSRQKIDSKNFWSNLRMSTVMLNGQTIRGDSIYGPERLFGALTRCILECDKCTLSFREAAAQRRIRGVNHKKSCKDRHRQDCITEMQAVRYAVRCLRNVADYTSLTKKMRLSVEALCQNRLELVPIEHAAGKSEKQSSSKGSPIFKISASSHFEKRNCAIEDQLQKSRMDRREWVYVRSKEYSNLIQRRFCILSLGVLCFYKQDRPRPCLLCGQLCLVGAKLGIRELCTDKSEGGTQDPNYILHVVAKESGGWSERELCFNDHQLFTEWRDALVLAIDTCSSSSHALHLINPISLDEMDLEHQRRLSNLSPETTRSPASLDLLEKDNDGVSWIIQHPCSTNSYRPSRTKKLLRKLDSFPEKALKKLPKPPLVLRGNSINNDSITEGSTLDSSVLNSNDHHDDMADQTKEPSVEIEIQTSSFYRAYTKDECNDQIEDKLSANRNAVLTIRATFILRLFLVGGKKDRVIKGQEIMKLDSLKGSVGEGAFDFIFDSKTTPQRRKSF